MRRHRVRSNRQRPFIPVQVGVRLVRTAAVWSVLASTVAVRVIIVPRQSACIRIRDDRNFWHRVFGDGVVLVIVVVAIAMLVLASRSERCNPVPFLLRFVCFFRCDDRLIECVPIQHLNDLLVVVVRSRMLLLSHDHWCDLVMRDARCHLDAPRLFA